MALYNKKRSRRSGRCVIQRASQVGSQLQHPARIFCIVLVAALALCACRSVGGASTGIPSARLDEAGKALSRGDAKAVVEMLRGRVVSSIRGSKLLGEAHLALGELREAREAFSRATALDPNDTEAWMSLGNACERDRFFDRAVDAYEKIMKVQPGHVDAARRLSFLLSDLGREAEAAQALRHAAGLDRDDDEIRYRLGAVELARGFYEEAESAFQSVLNRSENHTSAIHGRGLARAHQARAQQKEPRRAELLNAAEADLKRAMELSFGDPEPAYNYGWMCEELKKDRAAAAAAYRIALTSRPEHYNSLVRLASIMEAQKDYKSAYDLYQKAEKVATDPRAASKLRERMEYAASQSGGR